MESVIANNQVDTIANDNWVEIKTKRRQGPNMGKPLQGNPKDSIAGTTGKDTKGKDQELLKEDHNCKASDAPETFRGTREVKPTRWDKQPTPSPLNLMEG